MRRIRPHWPLVLAITGLLTSCGDGWSRSSATFSGMGDHPGLDPEERLRRSAFELVQGMSARRAIEFLEGDGFDCEGSTCLFQRYERESLLDVWVGVRPPGPARTWLNTWRIEVLGDPVESPQDLGVGWQRLNLSDEPRRWGQAFPQAAEGG